MEGEDAIMALPVGGEACSSSSSNRRRGGGAKCGRWNPTAEQVKVLMGLFRSGLRTPSTEQIQSITSHLSCYGKIESKNVFYWFQNHKARERHHKRRRRPATQSDPSLMQLAPAKRLPMGAGGTAATNGRTVQVPWEAQEERKMMETLELFPLKSSSCRDMQMDKMRMNMGWKDMTFLDAGRELRLNLR